MKLTRNQFIITSGTGLLGLCAGVLLVSGLPSSQSIAVASLLALPPTGIGLIVADSKAQGRVNKAERRLSDAQSELDTTKLKLRFTEDELTQLKSELTTLKNALQEAKEAVSAYIGVADENKRLQALVTAMTQKLEEFQGSYEERLEAAIEENWQECLERIKARNSQHRERERYLLGVIENMEPQFKASLQVLVQEYSELIASYESVIGSFHPELEAVKGEFSTRLQSVNEERDRVYAMLTQYQKPRLFEGNAYGATVGNAVLNFYLENDLIADPVRYESKGSGLIDVWVRPRTGTVDAYEKLGRELYIKQAYLAVPKFKIEDGSIKISLKCDVTEGRKKADIGSLPNPTPNPRKHGGN